MKIDISELKRENGSHKPFHIFQSCLPLSNGEYNEIQIDGELINNHSIIDAKGQIAALARYVCGRCLDSFQVSVQIPFSGSFREEHSIEDVANEDVFYYHGDMIDLSDLVQAELVLNEPIKLVCSVDCRGLCPVCGANLNQQTCECKNDCMNPQFAVLQKLLDREQS